MCGLSKVIGVLSCLIPATLQAKGVETRGSVAKCKKPSGLEGDIYNDYCTQFTCTKAKGKFGIWVDRPNIDDCCFQQGKGYQIGDVIDVTVTNCTETSLVCERREGLATIAAYSTWTCFQEILTKLDENGQGIDEVKTEVNENGQEIDEVKTEVNENGQGIDEVKTKVNGNGQGIDEIKTKVNENGQGIDEVKNEVNKNGQGIDEVKTEVNKNGQGIDEVKTEVNENGQGIDEVIMNVEDNGEKLDELLSHVIPNPGVLIVGGANSEYLNSAEEFNTNTGQTCSVGDLPQSNSGLSLCHRMVCGGWEAPKSCSKFEADSTFSTLPVSLRENRAFHLCWGLPSGEVLLLGGHWSRRTTERVSADGSSSSPDFDLPYDTNQACGIDLGYSYVVTGGWDGSTYQTVAQYSVTGEVTYLANLNTGRYAHACSKFVDDNGDTTLLVTGGQDFSNNYLSTTEIYVHSTWSYVSSLPSPRAYSLAATVDNVVYVFGGLYNNGTRYYFDEILSYNSSTNIWEIAGQMTEPSYQHAVSPLADLSGSCSSSPIAIIFGERRFNNSILHGEEGNELYKDKNLHGEDGNEFNEN